MVPGSSFGNAHKVGNPVEFRLDRSVGGLALGARENAPSEGLQGDLG